MPQSLGGMHSPEDEFIIVDSIGLVYRAAFLSTEDNCGYGSSVHLISFNGKPPAPKIPLSMAKQQ